MYTNLTESEFFTKSEYDFIKHEFNFDALAKLINKEFADVIENELLTSYIKKFKYVDRDSCFFLYFFADDGYNKDDFIIIKAYHNKDNYYSINKIDNYTFQELEMNVSFTNKRKPKKEV